MCSSLLAFSHFLHYSPSNWALLVLIPGGWVCAHSRTLWVSPMNSPVRLGVSPTAASTPTGVFNQWFEALFPCAGLGGLSRSPVVPPRLSTLECGTTCSTNSLARSINCCFAGQLQPCPPWSASCQLTMSPLCPSCPSLPLPLVWMNVSSLSPWLLDFHTVRFFVHSSCFLFLNCCCPSFGCARRYSVSTYTSIFAGTKGVSLYKQTKAWIGGLLA